MLEARGLIVRSKLMLPDGKGNSGWTTTQLIHLPRFAPRLAIGSEAIIRVRALEWREKGGWGGGVCVCGECVCVCACGGAGASVRWWWW
jgi:hypothetical protein